MMNVILLHVGAGVTAFWGIAHLVPTRSVVRGFGEITLDNRRIITMEVSIPNPNGAPARAKP